MEQKTEASQAVDEQWIFDLAAQYELPGVGLWGNVAFSSTGLVEFVRASLKAQPAPTEAQGEDSARLECAHANGHTASWDWVTCDDCGAIHTGSGEREWGVAQNMWFKNVAEAKFYKDNGRYPDRARASAETGGVKP